MKNNLSFVVQERLWTKNPWIVLLSTLAMSAGGLIVGSVLSMALVGSVLVSMGVLEDFESFERMISVSPEFKTSLLIIQAISAVSAFILFPILALKYALKERLEPHVHAFNFNVETALMAAFITVFFMGVNSYIIEWNESFVFPDGFQELESLLRDQEEKALVMTQLLTTFDSFGYTLFAFFVIAIIPGFGEELLFRGILQNQLYRISQNSHLAIWISAFIFSAIHMQFYGLVPRMLLGALFGYLYIWSGSIWIPMIAHATNNGFTVIMMYLHQQNIVQTDIEEIEPNPFMALPSILLCGLLIFVFYRKCNLKEDGKLAESF